MFGVMYILMQRYNWPVIAWGMGRRLPFTNRTTQRRSFEPPSEVERGSKGSKSGDAGLLSEHQDSWPGHEQYPINVDFYFEQRKEISLAAVSLDVSYARACKNLPA